jgi:hypothetical protein
MKIVFQGPEEMSWSAGVERESAAGYHCGAGWYKRFYMVDPRPCYTHDIDRVERELIRCEDHYPLLDIHNAELHVISHEFIDRNNGFTTSEEVHYRDNERWAEPFKRWDGEEATRGGLAHTIVICGKRIPPMPGHTRYIISHEYGHALFHTKTRLMGYPLSEEDKFKKRYMAARGQPDFVEGKRWHQAIGEIAANDFRFVVNSETEFWPHEVPPVKRGEVIHRWWTARTREEMEAILCAF